MEKSMTAEAPTAQGDALIKEIDFARYAAYMASHAAKWAAECCECADVLPTRHMKLEAVQRFTARMQGWLQTINAGAAQQPARPVQDTAMPTKAVMPQSLRNTFERLSRGAPQMTMREKLVHVAKCTGAEQVDVCLAVLGGADDGR